MYDMDGSFSEWVPDCLGDYSAVERRNFVDGPKQVFRGGDFGTLRTSNGFPNGSQSSARTEGMPSDQGSGLRFRLTKTAP